MRVAAGAIAKKYLLQQFGASVRGYLAQIGTIRPRRSIGTRFTATRSSAPTQVSLRKSREFIDRLRKDGDSIGARVTVVASGCRWVLGEPVFDKLDADIARALMSINAVKGVELAAGFDVVRQRGTEHRDEMTAAGFLSNNAGGVLGGISTGQDIVASPGCSADVESSATWPESERAGEEGEVVTTGRHDPVRGHSVPTPNCRGQCCARSHGYLMRSGHRIRAGSTTHDRC